MMLMLGGEEFSSKQREQTPLSNVASALDALSERINAAINAPGINHVGLFAVRRDY
jgi:hypothetical protein